MFKLSPEIQDKINACREAEHSYQVVFANLSNDQLADSAEFWMKHCDAPKHIEPGRPVYDSTLWHIILPELIRRMRNAAV